MIRKMVAILMVCILLTGAALAEYKELSVGSKDSSDDWAVYSLQLKLIELDYLDGSPDGVFGSGTGKAVAAFQEDHGMEATGVADIATQELLFSLEAEPGEASEESEEIIEQGQAGNDVYILQNSLYMWGFLTDAPDGVFGSATRQALSSFQKYALEGMRDYTAAKNAANTPEPTPVPTPAAQNADGGYDMATIEDEKSPEIPTDGTLTEDWLDYILNGFEPVNEEAEGSTRGDEVLRMQNRLKALGYIAAGNDGYFGDHTRVALQYFQQRNGLEETGVLDSATQQKLYSGAAVASDKYVSMYKALVSVDDQRVYIYKWTGSDYTALVHTFLCSTGTKANPTILGTFQAAGRNGEWYWMEDSKVWVRYAFVVEGGYFFHSVLYPTKDGEPTSTSVRNLGTRASHGCIRLSVEDAEWIYNNCANGMTVVIYEGDLQE